MSKSAMESNKPNLDSLKEHINEHFKKILKFGILDKFSANEQHKIGYSIFMFSNYFIDNLEVYQQLRDVAFEILNQTHISFDNCLDLILNLICKYFHIHYHEIFDAFLKFNSIVQAHNQKSLKYEDLLRILNESGKTIFIFFPKEHPIHQLDAFSDKLHNFKILTDTYEQSVYINNCEEFDESRRTRRLDSLAKLLNISSDFSVCSAVSIVNNQLLIACNINKGISPHLVACYHIESFLAIRKALHTLLENDPPPQLLNDNIDIDINVLFQEGFIETIEFKDLVIYFNRDYLSIVFHLINELKNAGGIFIKDTILFQAFTKLYASIVSNKKRLLESSENHSDDLTNNDINILLDHDSHPVILVPKKNDKTGKMGIQTYMQTAEVDFIKFLEKDENAEVHTFHAEQLIGFYIDNRMPECLNTQNKISLGISKPACTDCTQVLKDKFTFRATSNVSFLNTVQLSKHAKPISERPKRVTEANENQIVRKRSCPSTTEASRHHSIGKEAPKTPTGLLYDQNKRNVTHLQSSPLFSPEVTKGASLGSDINSIKQLNMEQDKHPVTCLFVERGENSASNMERESSGNLLEAFGSLECPDKSQSMGIDDNSFNQMRVALSERTRRNTKKSIHPMTCFFVERGENSASNMERESSGNLLEAFESLECPDKSQSMGIDDNSFNQMRVALSERTRRITPFNRQENASALNRDLADAWNASGNSASGIERKTPGHLLESFGFSSRMNRAESLESRCLARNDNAFNQVGAVLLQRTRRNKEHDRLSSSAEDEAKTLTSSKLGGHS